MKVTTYSQIKDGVTLLKDVTKLTAEICKDKVDLKYGKNYKWKKNKASDVAKGAKLYSNKIESKPYTKKEKNVLKNTIDIKTNVRDTQWQTASKVARTTAKVTATCAVALVGGLFAAIIAD